MRQNNNKKKQNKKNKRKNKTKSKLRRPLLRLPRELNENLIAIKELFVSYNPIDVYFAVSASDLWLPNISSFISHRLLFRIFASISPQDYTDVEHITSYSDFVSFITKAYDLLPRQPLAEDYIPCCDWGEVKYLYKNTFIKMFYGNDLETPYDYIDSFFIMHSEDSLATADMLYVLHLQDYLISNINTNKANVNLDEVNPGHLEVPSEEFWTNCLAVLKKCHGNAFHLSAVRDELIINCGEATFPESSSQFVEQHFQGTALPFVSVRVNDHILPVSIRHLAGTIIESWSKKDTKPDLKCIAANIYKLITDKVESNNLPVSSFKLASKSGVLPYQFAAAIHCQDDIHLILLLNIDEATNLQFVIDTIEKFIRNEDWAFWQDGVNGPIQLLDSSRKLIPFELINLVLVITTINLESFSIEIPNKQNCMILPLVDFILIINSLHGITDYIDFIKYIEKSKTINFLLPVSNADLFGFYKQNSGEMFQGAVEPDMLVIAPHSLTEWRYQELAMFSEKAPQVFPTHNVGAWRIEERNENSSVLISKSLKAISYSVEIGTCTLNFIVFVDHSIDYQVGRIIDQLANCLSDSARRRANILAESSIFQRESIISTILYPQESKESDSLFFRRSFNLNLSFDASHCVHLNANFNRVTHMMEGAVDSSFEIDFLKYWLEKISNHFSIILDRKLLDELATTSHWLPRFAFHKAIRPFDTPQEAFPVEPEDREYILARKEVSKTIKNLEITPGHYDNESAKRIIDDVRDHFRTLIHDGIFHYDRQALINTCIEQCDQLIAKHWVDKFTIKSSYKHEVEYDRLEVMGEKHTDFVRHFRCYRYLLELLLSNTDLEPTGVYISDDELKNYAARIDWLMRLYEASDTIHNSIDNVALIVDDYYIPELKYKNEGSEGQHLFFINRTKDYLDLEVQQTDNLLTSDIIKEIFVKLDNAFVADIDFSLTSFCLTFDVLAHWCSLNSTAANFIYSAKKDDLINYLTEKIENLEHKEAKSIVEFLVLRSDRVKRLVQKDVDEIDIPIWESNKRDHRYAIRPILEFGDNLSWGAASMSQSYQIWINSIVAGYLPADFPWPTVKAVISKTKKHLEDELVTKSQEVCLRFFDFVEKEIDFKRRMPKEKFDDVGDFDILAYQPQMNRWLVIECKYNRPVFCSKDARRLRDKIFGDGQDRGHIGKIEKRRDFFFKNRNKILETLKWPSPPEDCDIEYIELYVTKGLSLWMYVAPYDVPTRFVKIDSLDYFLKHNYEWSDSPL